MPRVPRVPRSPGRQRLSGGEGSDGEEGEQNDRAACTPPTTGGRSQMEDEICNSLITSWLEYGRFLLRNIDNSLKSCLDKIHRNALRIAMGYRMTTSLNIIYEESRVPTLSF